MIETNPYLWHESEIDDVQEYSLPRTPFSIIYRIKDNVVIVLRVWDGRADDTRQWS